MAIGIASLGCWCSTIFGDINAVWGGGEVERKPWYCTKTAVNEFDWFRSRMFYQSIDYFCYVDVQHFVILRIKIGGRYHRLHFPFR